MITTESFKKQISKTFKQEMKHYGFNGTGFNYFQETNDLLIAVYISPERWGGRCSAGFAIHPKQINKDYNGPRNLSKLKTYQYEFRMGLSTDEEISWNYSDKQNENLKTLFEIIELIKSTAFPVIKLFKESPTILDNFTVEEMKDFHENWTKKTGLRIATTDIRFAWVMALIFENRDIDKAKKFANWGLHLLKQDDNDLWFGKKDFENILSKELQLG